MFEQKSKVDIDGSNIGVLIGGDQELANIVSRIQQEKSTETLDYDTGLSKINATFVEGKLHSRRGEPAWTEDFVNEELTLAFAKAGVVEAINRDYRWYEDYALLNKKTGELESTSRKTYNRFVKKNFF